MSKGLAIETVLLLVIGIVVVASLVYMVYRYVVRSGLDKEQCKGVITSWCTKCYNFDPEWKTNGGPTQTDDLRTCVRTYFYSPQWVEDNTKICAGNNCYCRNFILLNEQNC